MRNRALTQPPFEPTGRREFRALARVPEKIIRAGLGVRTPGFLGAFVCLVVVLDPLGEKLVAEDVTGRLEEAVGVFAVGNAVAVLEERAKGVTARRLGRSRRLFQKVPHLLLALCMETPSARGTLQRARR